MDIKKPSVRFMKHGWLAPSETYDANIHNFGNTIAKRNIRWDDSGKNVGNFYDAASIQRMEEEITSALCPICLEIINDNCRVCDNGHKFHFKCDSHQRHEVVMCPTCKITSTPCNWNFVDTFSGGKKSKRKTYRKKKNRKRRTNRKKV